MGFTGEIPELKILCNYRKPNPGMVIQVAKKFNVDLEQSWIIGDGEYDISVGEAAKCSVKIIPTDGELFKAVKDILGETND